MPPHSDVLFQLSEVFKLLGDPTRLAILVSCLDDEKPVGQIAEETQASQSLVSHHLRLLRGARLVKSRRDGRQMFYKVHDHHISCTLKDMVAHIQEEDDL